MSSPNLSTLKTQLSTFQGDFQMCYDEKNASFSTILNTAGLSEEAALTAMNSTNVVYLSTSAICVSYINSTFSAIDKLPK